MLPCGATCIGYKFDHWPCIAFGAWHVDPASWVWWLWISFPLVCNFHPGRPPILVWAAVASRLLSDQNQMKLPPCFHSQCSHCLERKHFKSHPCCSFEPCTLVFPIRPGTDFQDIQDQKTIGDTELKVPKLFAISVTTEKHLVTFISCFRVKSDPVQKHN